jgi:hypothetical protein
MTKRGLSQHERHQHAKVRNEKRIASAASGSARPRPGGFGQVWTKEEIDLMLRLELDLQQERNIASKMCPFFPGKTNKQIRDKRAETTYKAKKAAVLSSKMTTMEEGRQIAEEGGLATNETEQERHMDHQAQNIRTTQSDSQSIPRIIVTDLSRPICPEESEWRKSLIKSVTGLKASKADISEKEEQMLNTLGDALKYAEAEDGLVPTAHIDHIYDMLIKHIKTGQGSPEKETPSRTRQRKKGRGKRKERRYIYARTQDLFHKDPGQLAKLVRENISWLERDTTQLPKSDIENLYKDLWEGTPDIAQPFSGELGRTEHILNLQELIPVITRKEIRGRIARMKGSTAAGPDGVRKGHITQASTQEMIRRFYIFITVCGRQPTAWRENRTTLLLKQGKSHADVRNYRPVTISSILSRVYWGVIDQKLRASVRFSPRQKGFINEAGCFNNVHSFNELLRIAKKKAGITVVQLDIAKAFDTIPHKAIGDALRRKGIPEALISLIEDSYVNVHTTIKQGYQEVPMSIKRGVKQGDPLSPFIFNAVLEPLLLQLEELRGYDLSNGVKVSSFAFADDIILVSSDASDAANLLRRTEEYLGNLGMDISANKSAAFTIKTTKDSWQLHDPYLSSKNGEKIPFSGAETTLHYLGGTFSPWKGLKAENIDIEFRDTLDRVLRLALKPQQKAELVTSYIMPHYLYTMVLAMVPVTTARKMDQDLRRVIKSIYHLPQCTANGLLHCGKKNGGLGIPQVEGIYTITTLKLGLKYKANPDPIMKAIVEESALEQTLQQIARTARINWPVADVSQLEKHKARMKEKATKEWAQLKSQGKAVPAFIGDKIGNAWLSNSTIFRPSKFITALKLRANVAGDRAALARAKITKEVNCRKCRAQTETLGHILGQCTYTKKERIERHDTIKDYILQRIVDIDKTASVTREPTLGSPDGGLLKPDLVVKNQEGVFVVDVTVRHEDKDYLQKGRQSKLDKYTPLLPELEQRLESTRAEVLPIVIGTRGALPQSTIEALEKVQISERSDLLTISLMAFRKSIEIYNNFMDYNAHLRAGSAPHDIAPGKGDAAVITMP